MVGVARGSSHLVHGRLQAPPQVRPLSSPSSRPALHQLFICWTFSSLYYQVKGPAGRPQNNKSESLRIWLGCSFIFKYASL